MRAARTPHVGVGPPALLPLGYPRGARIDDNVRVGSEEKRADRGWSHARVLGLAAGVTATVVAWGVLVFAAIDFGRMARHAQGEDWIFLVLATLGAVACMFLAIVLASRMQSLMRADPTRPHSPQPHQPGETPAKSAYPGGKRAAR